MPLSAGTKLGPYEVLSAIGAGGMGEVYKARDTRLDRIVAIKVLSTHLADRSELRERFEREAKTIASLNHPHICVLHDIGQQDGIDYLVMEYLEGETLAQRLQKGALPMEQVLQYAIEIADALDKAHRKGITHRDLKPGNVMLTKSGTKLLDFGLAKLKQEVAPAIPDSQLPTMKSAVTAEGTILGTLQYMAPEQVEGKVDEIDGRTDIFAFGVVVYEMATGKRAFEGKSPASVMGAIMHLDPPPMSSLQPVTPPALDRLVKTCLAKDPDGRWQSAGDVTRELKWIAEGGSQAGLLTASAKDSGATQAAPASTSKLPWAVAAVLAIIAVVALSVAWRSTRPVEQALRPLVRLDVDLGPDVSLGSQVGSDTILSPDGTRLVYVSQGRLFTRRLDQPNATELLGTQGASAPFFSPDGQWVAFFSLGKLQKISVEGGSAITLCEANGSRGGGSWGEDGNIIAALGIGGGLSRIPSAGGPPTPVTDLQSGEFTHRWPQVLPGGKAVLFTANKTTVAYDAANIDVMSLADHRRKTLVRGGTFGRYLPNGYLVYMNRGTLFAVPFDVDRLEVHGTPAPVLDQVGYAAGQGYAQIDFSQTGTLIYRSGGSGGGLLTIAWLDGAGKAQPLLAKPGNYGRPSMSPDGQRLALEVADGSGTAIWVYDWQRDTMTRLTFTGTAQAPVWSPDGRYIAFEAAGEGMSVTRSDGAGKPQPLTQSKNIQYPWSFTPDGKRLAFFEAGPMGAHLWTVPLESDSAGLRAGKPEVFLQTPADERYPSFSPDGRWVAYRSDESGTFQIYVRAFPDKGGKWQISNSGGTVPMWSRNGHELFFETLDNHIMVAAYTVKGDSFVADKPRVWSEKQLGSTPATTRNVDLAPDGKRIVALMPAETAEGQKAQNHVTFLLNFFDELRRKVPVAK
jgi:eukaryotic-like serine/threonine-protein kinase